MKSVIDIRNLSLNNFLLSSKVFLTVGSMKGARVVRGNKPGS